MPSDRLASEACLPRRVRHAFVGVFALVMAVADAEPGPYDVKAIEAFGRQLAAEKCARPVEVKTSFVRTPGDSANTDEMQSVDCRAFKVAVYRSRAVTPPREMPMSVVLLAGDARADRWGVGARASDVRATLGPPARTLGENLVYAIDSRDDGRDTVTFEVRDGLVRAVSWYWDVD